MTREKAGVRTFQCGPFSLLIRFIFFSFSWNDSKHLAGKVGVFFEIAKLFIEPLSSISISNSCSKRKTGKKRLGVNSSNIQ